MRHFVAKLGIHKYARGCARTSPLWPCRSTFSRRPGTSRVCTAAATTTPVASTTAARSHAGQLAVAEALSSTSASTTATTPPNSPGSSLNARFSGSFTCRTPNSLTSQPAACHDTIVPALLNCPIPALVNIDPIHHSALSLDAHCACLPPSESAWVKDNGAATPVECSLQRALPAQIIIAPRYEEKQMHRANKGRLPPGCSA